MAWVWEQSINMLAFIVVAILSLASAQTLPNQTSNLQNNRTGTVTTNGTSAAQQECLNAVSQLNSNCKVQVLEFAKMVQEVCPGNTSCTSDQNTELTKKICLNSDALTNCLKDLVGNCITTQGFDVNALKPNCEKLGLPTGNSTAATPATEIPTGNSTGNSTSAIPTTVLPTGTIPTETGSDSTSSGNGLRVPIYVSLLGMILLFV